MFHPLCWCIVCALTQSHTNIQTQTTIVGLSTLIRITNLYLLEETLFKTSAQVLSHLKRLDTMSQLLFNC